MPKKQAKPRPGNPQVNFRLSPESLENLDAMASLMGQTRGEFLREFISLTCGGDLEALGDYLSRCWKKAAEKAQMSLPGIGERSGG